MTNPLFLGVDAGQSSTRAVIGDQAGKVIATGEGGPIDHVGAPGGRQLVFDALRASIGSACRQIGRELETTSFEGAFLGFTGAEAGKRAIVESVITAGRIGLSDDSVIALTGALDGEPGIITIAGTGSISFGRNHAAQTARAGGWGYVFGDEGSALDLVRQAMRAALRFEEGWGPPTILHELLRETAGLDDIRLVQRSLYSSDVPRKRIASLAPLVDKAAEGGDAVAADILEQAAAALVTITHVVRMRLFADEDLVTVARVGGAFRSARLLAAFVRQTSSRGRYRVIAPVHEPPVGALIEAYRLAGRAIQVRGGL